MSNTIAINGRYTSYEVEIVDEMFADSIIKNGISEDDMNNLMFEDGNDTGIYECQILFNGQVVDHFNLEKFDLTDKKHQVAIGWLLVKLETGKINYTKEINENFNLKFLEFATYSDLLNTFNVDYAYPMYEEEDFEIEWKENNTFELLLISPDGQKFAIGMSENENSEFIKGYIDTLVAVKFKNNFSRKESFWKQGTIGAKKEIFDYIIQAFGYYDEEDVFELAYMAIRDANQEILYFGLPDDFGCETDSENSFEKILTQNCNMSIEKSDIKTITNYIEGSILWRDPDTVLVNSNSDYTKIGERSISIEGISKESISKICLYAYRDIFPINPATLNYSNKIGPQLGEIMTGVGGPIHNLITATILFSSEK